MDGRCMRAEEGKGGGGERKVLFGDCRADRQRLNGSSQRVKNELSRSDIRFRMARSRKSVIVASGRYFRDSLKPF